MGVVWRGDPFQITVASLVNVVPLAAFTSKGKPLTLPQYGIEVGERDAIAGGVPGAELIVNSTMLEISVVVVLLTVVAF